MIITTSELINRLRYPKKNRVFEYKEYKDYFRKIVITENKILKKLVSNRDYKLLILSVVKSFKSYVYVNKRFFNSIHIGTKLIIDVNIFNEYDNKSGKFVHLMLHTPENTANILVLRNINILKKDDILRLIKELKEFIKIKQ